MKWDEIRETIGTAIYDLEADRARGDIGDGRWHYVRVYPDPDGESVTVVQGVEPTRTIPVSEWEGRRMSPVTVYTVQEAWSPDEPGDPDPDVVEGIVEQIMEDLREKWSD